MVDKNTNKEPLHPYKKVYSEPSEPENYNNQTIYITELNGNPGLDTRPSEIERAEHNGNNTRSTSNTNPEKNMGQKYGHRVQGGLMPSNMRG